MIKDSFGFYFIKQKFSSRKKIIHNDKAPSEQKQTKKKLYNLNICKEFCAKKGWNKVRVFNLASYLKRVLRYRCQQTHWNFVANIRAIKHQKSPEIDLKAEHLPPALSYLNNIRSVKVLIFDWLRSSWGVLYLKESICAEDCNLRPSWELN